MRVTVRALPKGRDKHEKEVEIIKHLSELSIELKGASRVTVGKPITTTLTTYNMEKLKSSRT